MKKNIPFSFKISAIVFAIAVLLPVCMYSTMAQQTPVEQLFKSVERAVRNCARSLRDLNNKNVENTKTDVVADITAVQNALAGVLTTVESIPTFAQLSSKAAEYLSKTNNSDLCNEIPTDAENPEIRVIENIAQILPCVQPGSLIVFDMDETLRMSKNVVLGSVMPGFEYSVWSEEKVPGTNIFIKDQDVLINPDTPDILDAIRAAGAHIIILTNSSLQGVLWRIQTNVDGLQKIADKLDAIISTKSTNGFKFPRDMRERTAVVKKILESEISLEREAQFINWLYSSSVGEKADYINKYVADLELTPANILLVDDDKTHNLIPALHVPKIINFLFIKGVELKIIQDFNRGLNIPSCTVKMEINENKMTAQQILFFYDDVVVDVIHDIKKEYAANIIAPIFKLVAAIYPQYIGKDEAEALRNFIVKNQSNLGEKVILIVGSINNPNLTMLNTFKKKQQFIKRQLQR